MFISETLFLCYFYPMNFKVFLFLLCDIADTFWSFLYLLVTVCFYHIFQSAEFINLILFFVFIRKILNNNDYKND